MHLTLALQKQAYIAVTTDTEKADVVNILQMNEIKYNPMIEKSGRFISLFTSKEWNFTGSDENKYGYPTISAAYFIASNTPKLDPNPCATYSSNIV